MFTVPEAEAGNFATAFCTQALGLPLRSQSCTVRSGVQTGLATRPGVPKKCRRQYRHNTPGTQIEGLETVASRQGTGGRQPHPKRPHQ